MFLNTLIEETRSLKKLRLFFLCVRIFDVETRIELLADPAEHKKRLEDFLFDRFSGLSKMYLRDVVKNQKCQVNGSFENRGYLVRSNDFVEIELDLSRQTAMQPEEVGIDVVFEDAAFIVVNKPAGMLVHPTHRDKNGTLLNALSHHLNYKPGAGNVSSSVIRPGLVHRLDKQTSGLMVIAKTGKAHRVLADHFKRRLVGKCYMAVADGIVEKDSGDIEAPIGRYADQKFWDIKTDGKPARTEFSVIERYADRTLLELTPITGRTNQLRIHCASIGHPIVGDTARGGSEFHRLCLHAHRLSFRHPFTGELLTFAADVKFI